MTRIRRPYGRRSPPYELQLSARFESGLGSAPGWKASQRRSSAGPGASFIPARRLGGAVRLVGSAVKSGPCCRRPFTSGPARGPPSRRASVLLPRPGTRAWPDQWVSRARGADQQRAKVAGPGPQAVLALKRPHARRLGLFCEGSLNPSRGLCASLAQRARGECEHRRRGGGGSGAGVWQPGA